MPDTVVRTQIYLPRKLHRELRAVARARGVSMAQLIREAAAQAIRTAAAPDDAFEDLIGAAGKGPADLSERHDDYLVRGRRR